MPASSFCSLRTAQAMRGVLWAIPKRPWLSSRIIPPWPLTALFQVIHRFLRYPLRQAARLDAISCPFGEDQFHDGFSPTRGRCGGAFVVGVAAAADQR